ncbi:MAG TPA: hypothetical protein V6D26_17350, partial [Stenomitos sp.]
ENFILCAIGVGNFHLLGQNFSSYMQIRGLKVPSVRGKNFNLCANRQVNSLLSAPSFQWNQSAPAAFCVDELRAQY